MGWKRTACEGAWRRLLLASVCVWLGLCALSAEAAQTAWIIPETVNLRSGPGTGHDLRGRATRGTKFFVTETRSGWCRGKLTCNTWGWIRQDLLEFSPQRGRHLAAGGSPTSAPPATNPPVWVSVSNANVRSGPGLGYSRYGTLPIGAKLYVLERRGEWLRCRTPGGEGWLNQSVVTSDPGVGQRLASQAPEAPKAFVDGDNVNLRRGPGTSQEVVARLTKGQTVWLLEEGAEWSKVRVHEGAAGWIANFLLKRDPGAATGSSSPAASSAPSGSSNPPPPANFPDPTSNRFTSLPAWINEDVVNVREGPGTERAVRVQLKRDDAVTVLALDGHWCQIRSASGTEGWVAGWVMDFSPPGKQITAEVGDQQVQVNVGWVARPTVNLRSGPGENYPRMGSLSLSTELIIFDQRDDWYQVAMDNGERGWIASWLVDTKAERLARSAAAPASGAGSSPAPAASLGSGGNEQGREIVRTAMHYLGNRYVRGGASPGGFDCSGLVSYVLGRHGVRVSRSSTDQYRQGRPVSRENLEPGDVVFFANTYRAGISHVGFYLGGGRFIHAANPGAGVRITELGSSYYAPRYVGARRMH